MNETTSLTSRPTSSLQTSHMESGSCDVISSEEIKTEDDTEGLSGQVTAGISKSVQLPVTRVLFYNPPTSVSSQIVYSSPFVNSINDVVYNSSEYDDKANVTPFLTDNLQPARLALCSSTMGSNNSTMISNNSTMISNNSTMISNNSTMISNNTTMISNNSTMMSNHSAMISNHCNPQRQNSQFEFSSQFDNSNNETVYDSISIDEDKTDLISVCNDNIQSVNSNPISATEGYLMFNPSKKLKSVPECPTPYVLPQNYPVSIHNDQYAVMSPPPLVPFQHQIVEPTAVVTAINEVKLILQITSKPPNKDTQRFPLQIIILRSIQIMNHKISYIKENITPDLPSLDQQQTTNDAKTCKICKFKTPHSTHLVDHIRNTHVLSFQCTNCGSDTKMACKDLEEHLKQKHNRNKKVFNLSHTLGEIINDCNTIPLLYSCLFCDKLFCDTNTSSLFRSITSHHNENHFLCKICGVNFKTKEQLFEHVDTMTVKILECSFCGLTFRRWKTLQEHLENHCTYNLIYNKFKICSEKISGIKQFSYAVSAKYYDCPYCNIRAAIESGLSFLFQHLNSHQCNKCSICKQVYIPHRDIPLPGETSDICETCICTENSTFKFNPTINFAQIFLNKNKRVNSPILDTPDVDSNVSNPDAAVTVSKNISSNFKAIFQKPSEKNNTKITKSIPILPKGSVSVSVAKVTKLPTQTSNNSSTSFETPSIVQNETLTRKAISSPSVNTKSTQNSTQNVQTEPIPSTSSENLTVSQNETQKNNESETRKVPQKSTEKSKTTALSSKTSQNSTPICNKIPHTKTSDTSEKLNDSQTCNQEGLLQILPNDDIIVNGLPRKVLSTVGLQICINVDFLEEEFENLNYTFHASEVIDRIKDKSSDSMKKTFVYCCKYCKGDVRFYQGKTLFDHFISAHNMKVSLSNMSSFPLSIANLLLYVNDIFDTNLTALHTSEYFGDFIDTETNKRYKCLYCNQLFTIKDFYDHVLNKHPNCRVCHKIFNNINDLNNHIHQHNKGNIKFYVCPFCNITFKTLPSLLKHKAHKHVTNVSFFSITSRFYDIQNDGPLPCPYCSEISTNKTSFLVHYFTHKLELCALCNKNYMVGSKSKSLQPDAIHDCYYEDSFVSDLLPNSEVSHSHSVPIKEFYYINVIDNTFMQIYHLNKVPMTPVIVSKDNLLSQRSDILRDLKCLYCEKTFKYDGKIISSLYDHVSSMHHSCRVCNGNFATVDDKINHDIKHNNGDIKFFKCSFCCLELKSLESLEKHLCLENDELTSSSFQTVTKKLLVFKELTHKCPYCCFELAMGNYSVLMSHVGSHTSFNCVKCNKLFVPSLEDSVFLKNLQCILCHLQDQSNITTIVK